MSTFISIKNLALDDRPREKLMQNGYASLSNSEILGILIGSGTKKKSAVELCREILNDVGDDLNKLAKLNVKDLQKFNGIGEAKAITIIAALELGRRRKDFKPKSKIIVKSAADAFGYINHLFEDLNHEEFHILLLNRANAIKGSALISKGGISGTVADGKLIFKKALEEVASAIILCHNHPSGNLKPSKADIQLTKRLKEFGSMIDLPVLDHIIFTDNDYFSFADEGIL